MAKIQYDNSKNANPDESREEGQGLSRRMKQYGQRHNDSSFKRWIPLVMADRVGVIERIIGDIRHKRFPTVIREKGILGFLNYTSKKALIRHTVIATLITTGAITLLVLRNRKKAKLAAANNLQG